MPLNLAASAVRYIELASTRAGRNAKLSNPDEFGDLSAAKVIVANAHKRLDDGIRTLDKLTKDESRTEPQRHHRAKQEAEAVNHQLAKGASELRTLAKEQSDRADEVIDGALKVDAINPVFLARKMDYIAECWKREDGVARLNEAVKVDAQLGAVLCHADAYLLGDIPHGLKSSLLDKAISIHAPEAMQRMAVAGRLNKAADKMERATSDVSNSFYVEAIANKMSTRVE